MKINASLFVLCLIILSSCNLESNQKKESKGFDSKVEQLLSEMTLEQKVGQMMQINVDLIMKGEIWNLAVPNEVDLNKVDTIIGQFGTGSILNCGGHTWPRETWYSIHKAIQEKAQETSGIPVLYGVDAIHGVNYTQGATLFPQQLAQAATWNPSIVKQAAEITAYETRASGIPWNFSPVLDLGRQPLWSRFFETYGEDVYLAQQMTEACIEGYQGDDVSDKTKVAACMKHFLGYSNSFTGKDRTPVYMAERQLREYYLPTFQTAISSGAKTVMINSGEINGIPVHSNKAILVDLLRDELGFEGVAVTDWEDILKLYQFHKVAKDEKEATKMAINAGIDMSMVPIKTSFYKYLIELVNEGEVPMSRINESVGRILQLKVDLGLFENPYFPMEDYPEFGSEKSAQVSLDAARESITLLKNENVLPLSKSEKVLVTGPAANSLNIMNGAWTHTWQGVDDKFNTKGKLTIEEALKVKSSHITFVEGASLDKEINIEKAVAAARGVDKIVVCLGEIPNTEKVGDINTLNMPTAQINLVKALAKLNKPMVLVLVENRPRIINEIEDMFDGVLMAYLPGDMGGIAVSEIIFGEVNPSGKLPFTYPRNVNDIVLYDHKATEDLDPSFGNNAFNPQYEFGTGLSYTQFAYSNLKMDTVFAMENEINVSVEVKNIGKVEGKEVIQVYVRDEVASITPSVKRLRAFEKVNLKPGESKTVQFSIQSKDLGFVGIENEWITENGAFTLMIDSLKTKFTIK